MKQRLNLILVLCMMTGWVHAGYENAVQHDIHRRHVAFTDMASLYNVRMLPGTYGSARLSDTISFPKIAEEQLSEIWLVHTGFSVDPGFDQEQLNLERVRELERNLPFLRQNNTVRWTRMRVTGIDDIDTARLQYHGFIFIYKYDYGPSLGEVLDRNRDWDSLIVVMDVTTSMLPWLQEASVWLENNVGDKRIDRFVYYNDGDGMPDNEKIPGQTGGIHADTSGDYLSYMRGIKRFMVMGFGNNDNAENALEALLQAQRQAGPGSVILWLADNYSIPRDTCLIDSLIRPVRVIACGTQQTDILPALVNVAYRTRGSLHTCFQDVRSFHNAKLPAGRSVVFSAGEHQYITQGRQLKCVTCKESRFANTSISPKRR